MNAPGRRRGTLIGHRIGNVRVTTKIGQGGVGAVYLAEHLVLGTPYAVKILHPRVSTDKTTVERFKREAIACGRLNHPNVIFVSDFGYKEGVGIYIIMEYIKGESLMGLLQRERQLEPATAVRIALQICDALEAAHQLGIVHRDLKPANVLVTSVVGNTHHVKVLDFGIALLKDQQNLTAAGLTVGSPHYMSPEQIQGRNDLVGPGSDIYSLGVLLYQMLSGAFPIWHQDLMMLCHMQLTHIPEPISKHRPELADSRLEALIARMLAKPIQDRPASMVSVTEILKEALAELEVVEEAVEEEESRTELFNPARYRILNIVHNIRQRSAGSPLLAQIERTPALLEQSEETFRAMVWGMVCTDLAYAQDQSRRLSLAAASTAVLVESAIDPTAERRDDPFLASVGALMRGLDRTRQRAMVEALQPLLNHANFPQDLIPEWARVYTSGTWKNPFIEGAQPTLTSTEPVQTQKHEPTVIVNMDPPPEEAPEPQSGFKSERTRPMSNLMDVLKDKRWKR